MSASRIEVSEDARQDLALQHAWYAREAGADIAERYLKAFRSTAELIARQPGIGVLRKFRSPRLKDIRSFQLASPFRIHLIFYRVEGDCLVVFRVMHGMRDLQRRLTEPPCAD
jgi:plasmid stabilization system protein ParE